MLSVVNSGKFILTLQSTPPFVIESIFAVALAVLLAVPLITNLQFFLEKPPKRKRNIRNSTIADTPSNESNKANKNHKEINRNESSSERIRRAIVMHYPAPISIGTSSSSDLDPQVGTLSRRSVSTPNVCSKYDEDGWSNNGNYKAVIQHDKQQRVHEFVKKIKPKKDALLDGSSSFVATNSELPIIDISTFNYNSYRHKLIEASLKKRYRERQPPGDVIFNSIHLNTTDSTLGLRLNEEYDHSFFDFIEEYYDATTGMSRKEMEFLHPLDHFLVRGECKLETSEKATETTSRTENQTDQRENLVDNKPIDRHALDKNGNISKAKSKNFSKISKKPGDESSRSMDKRKSFEGNGGATEVSLVDSNSINTGLKTARKSSNENFNSRKPTSSIVKAGKGSINASLSSSDELDSTYSETEKKTGNATSNHSRDSSRPPSRGRATTRKPIPWISGNASVSFNKKYGNKSPEILDNSTKRKVRSSERPSIRSYSEKTTPRPRSANLGITSRKTNYQNSLELVGTVKGIGYYTVSKEKLNRSNKSEITSSTLENPQASISPSRISPTSSSKLFISSKNNGYRRSGLENVADKTYAKIKEKRVRAGGTKVTKTTTEDNYGNITESWKESTLRSWNNESKPRNDIFLKKETSRTADLSNFDKTRKISRGDKSDRCSTDKTDCSRFPIESRNTLVLATNDSRAEKYSFGNQILSKESDNVTNEKNLANEENISEELMLPENDSKIGLAMRTSLKNYIKTLKQVLKSDGNVDMVDLASLSLKNAISPELESILSSSELKELQDLLNIAEIKSNLAVNDAIVT